MSIILVALALFLLIFSLYTRPNIRPVSVTFPTLWPQNEYSNCALINVNPGPIGLPRLNCNGFRVTSPDFTHVVNVRFDGSRLRDVQQWSRQRLTDSLVCRN